MRSKDQLNDNFNPDLSCRFQRIFSEAFQNLQDTCAIPISRFGLSFGQYAELSVIFAGCGGFPEFCPKSGQLSRQSLQINLRLELVPTLLDDGHAPRGTSADCSDVSVVHNVVAMNDGSRG